MLDDLVSAYKTLKRVFEDKHESSEESIHALLLRPMGATMPVSIGTAMIVESEFSDTKKWHDRVYINLRTLLRNIIHAIPTEDRDVLQADDVLDALIKEMHVLNEVLPEYKPGVTVGYYLPDYSDIFKKFKRGNPRLNYTPRMKEDIIMAEKVFRKLEQRKEDEQPLPEYDTCGWELDKHHLSTTLLTSYPSDLLSQYRFPRCNLVESHTGRVKERKHWSSKLNHTENDDMSTIPFNKFTLTVFGDGVLFLVSNRKVKKLVLGLASRDQWNYLTTEARIRGSISRMHVQDRDILMEYF